MFGLIALLPFGCSPPVFDYSVNRPVKEEEVLGTWISTYRQKPINGIEISGKEVMVLRADGSYERSFVDSGGDVHRLNASIWKLTNRNYDGKPLITLTSMRPYWEILRPVSNQIASEDTTLNIEIYPRSLFGLLKEKTLLCFPNDDLNICFGRAEDDW